MLRGLLYSAVLLYALLVVPAQAAEQEEASDAQVYLLAATNQGGLQKVPMQSMEACREAADALYEQDGAYAGPTLYFYCLSDDGKVWAFDRWNREE